MPYLSTNISEFWQRWHISLSSWLRDYLYISLGGNRKGQSRTYANLMITMILGGLWHGASWNFILWGTLHGVALVLHKLWSDRSQKRRGTPVILAVSTALTFLFVTLSWVPFRAQDPATMLLVFQKLFYMNSTGASWFYQAVFLAIVWCIIGHLFGSLRQEDELIFFETPYSYQAAFAVSGMLLLIYVFAPTNTSPFIYFQF
jgi:alginate O-acetyltransferase complex protein AlgI